MGQSTTLQCSSLPVFLSPFRSGDKAKTYVKMSVEPYADIILDTEKQGIHLQKSLHHFTRVWGQKKNFCKTCKDILRC